MIDLVIFLATLYFAIGGILATNAAVSMWYCYGVYGVWDAIKLVGSAVLVALTWPRFLTRKGKSIWGKTDD